MDRRVVVAFLCGLVSGAIAVAAWSIASEQAQPNHLGSVYVSGNPSDYNLRGASCGESTLGGGAVIAPAHVRCLLSAFASGDPTHLLVRQSTDEGDPVYTAYQVTGVASVQVSYDGRDDTYGSGKLTVVACSSLVESDNPPGLEVSDCR